MNQSFIVSSAQYQSNVIKYHMRRDIREAAGLGNPPSMLYHQLMWNP